VFTCEQQIFRRPGLGPLCGTTEDMMGNEEERRASELHFVTPATSALNLVGVINEPWLRRQPIEIVERDLGVADWVPPRAIAKPKFIARAYPASAESLVLQPF